ncbi:MAG: VOC family protein [Methylobacterium mesophilicum]|nr:VOC family protein [Methylobacterium mesophilicum]
MQGISGIGHVAIKVRDIERTLRFYRDALGFSEMLRLFHDDGSLFLIYLRITDTQYLEIFPEAESGRAAGPKANGIHHMCLTVDRLEPVLNRIRANGETVFIWRDGELQPTDADPINTGLDRNRQAWIEDPDGNRIEFMEMAENSLQAEAIGRLRAEKT